MYFKTTDHQAVFNNLLERTDNGIVRNTKRQSIFYQPSAKMSASMFGQARLNILHCSKSQAFGVPERRHY